MKIFNLNLLSVVISLGTSSAFAQSPRTGGVDLQSVMVNEVTQTTTFVTNRDLVPLEGPGYFGTKEHMLESARKSNVRDFFGTSKLGERPYPLFLRTRACSVYLVDHKNNEVPAILKKGTKFEMKTAGLSVWKTIEFNLVAKESWWHFDRIFQITCNQNSIGEDSTLQELATALNDAFTIVP